MAYSERRAKDRAMMAERLAAAVQAAGYSADVAAMGPREIWVSIETPEGLRLTVDFDGASLQPDVHVLSWNSRTDATFKLAPGFAPSVNPYHWHKATDICEGFDDLLATVARRLRSVADGSAFQGRAA